MTMNNGEAQCLVLKFSGLANFAISLVQEAIFLQQEGKAIQVLFPCRHEKGAVRTKKSVIRALHQLTQQGKKKNELIILTLLKYFYLSQNKWA
jgi:hypothetical protein